MQAIGNAGFVIVGNDDHRGAFRSRRSQQSGRLFVDYRFDFSICSKRSLYTRPGSVRRQSLTRTAAALILSGTTWRYHTKETLDSFEVLHCHHS
jgi:hypothetical protein